MGKLINANNEEFQAILDSEKGTILVDFWAEWCGPCRTLGPILEDVADEVDNVTIIKINVDENSETSAEYGVRSIPTVVVFSGGEQVDKFVGVQSKDAIIAVINKNSESEVEAEESEEEADGSED